MSSQFRLSADGLFYWSETSWVSALSPDGRHRWDGGAWVPIHTAQAQPPYRYHAIPAPAPRRASRVATSLTRPLQFTVVGFFALSVVVPVFSIAFAIGDIHDYTAAVARQQVARSPDLYPDPARYVDTMVGFVDVLFIVVIVFIVAVAAVAVAGALRRWTWTYYAVLAWLALTVLGLPSAVLRAAGAWPGPAMPPTLQSEQWISVAYALIATAVGAWMLYLLLRVGPWAARRAAG